MDPLIGTAKPTLLLFLLRKFSAHHLATVLFLSLPKNQLLLDFLKIFWNFWTSLNLIPQNKDSGRDKMQKSGKFENIQVENDAEVVKTENGIKIDPISIYAKTQHIFAEVCFEINIPCYWLVQIFE